MTRQLLKMTALAGASLFLSATAAAQGASVTFTAPTAPTAPSVSPPAVPGMEAVPVSGAATAAGPAAAAAGGANGKVVEDMTGAIGFGVGIIPNSQLVGTTSTVGIKAWLGDGFALAPLLGFHFTAPSSGDATWSLKPEVVLLFAPIRGASTRFELGGGVGFGVGKAAPLMGATSSDTTFDLYVPIQAGVEHFFTRWFSTGIAARMNLFDFNKVGSASQVSFSIDSTSLLGQLFFYTD